MDLTLDQDLSEQLKSCQPGEKITLQGTVSANEAGAVEVNLDSAMPSEGEEAGESGGYGGVTEGDAGAPMGPEEQPAIPGPVKMLLKRR